MGGKTPRPASFLLQEEVGFSVQIGDVRDASRKLANGCCLAGFQIDLVERAAIREPCFVFAFALGDDVEGDRAVDLEAEFADRVQYAVVRGSLPQERADRGVD